MSAETMLFTSRLNRLVEELTPHKATGAEGDNADRAMALSEDLPYFREKLFNIHTACLYYDKRAAEDAVTELREREWTVQTEKLLSKISEHLLHSDFDEVAGIISTYTE